MPTSFSHIDLFLVALPLPLLRLLQNSYCYFCHRYRYFHTTLLLNTLLQILSLSGVVELIPQMLILENILWLPLCRINKFGLNTLPSKTVVIPYTCGLSWTRANVTLRGLKSPSTWMYDSTTYRNHDKNIRVYIVFAPSKLLPLPSYAIVLHPAVILLELHV